VVEGVEFRAISVDASLSPGDAVAVTASGQLHLRLSKESYQKIGLLGSKSNADPGMTANGGEVSCSWIAEHCAKNLSMFRPELPDSARSSRCHVQYYRGIFS